MVKQFDRQNPLTRSTPSVSGRLLGTSTERPLDSRKLKMIRLDQLVPFSRQAYNRQSDTKIAAMARSMDLVGLADPIIVRYLADEHYEILAGHTRWEAAKILGWETIMAREVECSDEVALYIVVTTNDDRRETLLPSERARALKLRMEALRAMSNASEEERALAQAVLEEATESSGEALKRIIEDENSTPEQREEAQSQIQAISNEISSLDTGSVVSAAAEMGRSYVFRMIKLLDLIPELMVMVDESQISINSGSQLAYLSDEEQKRLVQFMSTHVVQITREAAEDIRRLAKDDELTEATLCKYFGITRSVDVQGVEQQIKQNEPVAPPPLTPKRAVDQMSKRIKASLRRIQRNQEMDDEALLEIADRIEESVRAILAEYEEDIED